MLPSEGYSLPKGRCDFENQRPTQRQKRTKDIHIDKTRTKDLNMDKKRTKNIHIEKARTKDIYIDITNHWHSTNIIMLS